MTDSKDPIEVELSELHRYKLEAAETQAKLVKERLIAEITRKHDVLRALEVKQALDTSAQVRVTELRINAVTNEVIEALKKELPDGYALKMLSWETGKVLAEYNPEQAKQKLPETVQVPQEDAPPVE